MRVLFAILVCGVVPAGAAAQTGPPELPDNDTIISIGWAGAEHHTRDQRRWHGSLLAGARVGHYWTDHLKTEVEAGWSAPRTDQIYETIERSGAYTFAISDYRSHDLRVGVAQLYQFGRNQWVHPYIGIGADLVRRSAAIDRQLQSRTVFLQNRSTTVDIPAGTARETSTFAQAVLKTGVKMYVSEKAFFDTELKLGLRQGVDHLVWKFGVGVDF
jgi:hypothetical protein